VIVTVAVAERAANLGKNAPSAKKPAAVGAVDAAGETDACSPLLGGQP